MSLFKKAVKSSARLRLALIGPAGSGKTWTSLVVATAFGGRIAVIDTEKGSASKYASDFDFDVLELEEFHPQRYVEAIREAGEAGYTSIVIDSLSHAWVGKGGGLELHDNAVARQKTKNSYTAWSEVTPHHNALVNALVQAKCHVIATMRAKTEYVQEKDERGRSVVRKVGLAPIQRDGLEYEFDVVGDMDFDNTLVITKSRCPVLANQVIQRPGKDFAATLKAWLGDGPVPDRNPAPPSSKLGDGYAATHPPASPAKHPPTNGHAKPADAPRGTITEAQLTKLAILCNETGYGKQNLQQEFNLVSRTQLSKEQASKLIDKLQKMADAQPKFSGIAPDNRILRSTLERLKALGDELPDEEVQVNLGPYNVGHYDQLTETQALELIEKLETQRAEVKF